MSSFGKLFTWFSLVGLFAVVPLAAVGCGGGDDDDDDMGDGDADGDSDADGDADNDPAGGPEQVFVADSLAIGDKDQGEGFNLDDHDTTSTNDPVGCGKPDGPDGIDNQLGPLVESIVAAVAPDQDPNLLLAENIQDGSLLLLSRLLDVDAADDDPHVPLYFYLGDDPDADPSNNLDGTGEFTVKPSSLDGATLDDPLIHFDDGYLRGGNFGTSPSVFQITIPISADVNLDLAIERAQIRFHYTEEGLTEGVVGGYVDNEAILAALQNRDLGDIEIPVEMVRSVLAAQADIDQIDEGSTGVACTDDNIGEVCLPSQGCCPPGTSADACETDGCPAGSTCECYEMADRCDALSLGLRFTAVPATITGITPQ